MAVLYACLLLIIVGIALLAFAKSWVGVAVGLVALLTVTYQLVVLRRSANSNEVHPPGQ